MMFKRFIKWLFLKKIKSNNYIHIDATGGKHGIVLQFDNHLTDEEYANIGKLLETLKRRLDMENIVFSVMDGIQISKVMHISDYTIHEYKVQEAK